MALTGGFRENKKSASVISSFLLCFQTAITLAPFLLQLCPSLSTSTKFNQNLMFETSCQLQLCYNCGPKGQSKICKH